jgi:transcriptional regulator with XRE-family HTH domain
MKQSSSSSFSISRPAHVPDKILDQRSRRHALASFLRAKRESLSPSDLGMPFSGRRRVKGLRRDEVAEEAGVSVAWYSWIEQARNLNISSATLDRLSMALRLSPEEGAYLYRLAGHCEHNSTRGNCDEILPLVQATIDNMDPNPTYALNPHWDVIVWNNAASTILCDFGSLPTTERNFLRVVFTNDSFRKRYVNWEEVAFYAIAQFRSDSVSLVEDPRWHQLVDELTSRSQAFREWWPRHGVVWRHNGKKELEHPQNGRLVYASLDLELQCPDKLRIVTYIPMMSSSSK